MSNEPVRAVFTERQVLGSADLNTSVDHQRETAARTMRAVTTPGVLSGLEFVSTDVPVTIATGSVITKQIRLSRGLLCDEFGRLIVVPDDVPLGPEYFLETTKNATPDPASPDRTVPYPVFIEPIDKPRRSSATIAGRCSTTASPTRIAESFEIRIGRPGEELPRQLPPIAPMLGPEGDGTIRPILLGFVRFHIAAKQFIEYSSSFGQSSRQYGGIQADSLNGRHGRVAVRASARGEAGSPVMLLESAGDTVLSVGTLTPQGGIEKLFWIDSKGDAFAKGALHGRRTEGQIAVESGIINDGLRVPLPAGVTEADVQGGAVVLHIALTPRFPDPLGDESFTVQRCKVDNNRRVSCQLGRLTLVPAPAVVIETASAHYQVIASVPPVGAQS